MPGYAVPDYVASLKACAVGDRRSHRAIRRREIRHAYGFDKITFNNGTVAGDGSGTTIAIVDAYDDPNIANDLHQFDLQFGLPDPVFTKVNQTGGTQPARRPTRAGPPRSRLDVEWAHADRPGGQHPAGRGQQQLVQRLADGGRLRPACGRRGGGVDELGRRRVLRRERATTATSPRPAAMAG